MFSHVIVKTPCTAMVHGITGHPELGAPDYEKALEQHRAYIETLRQCGVDVTVLPADEAYPDSCFVEDAAVLTKYCAVYETPGGTILYFAHEQLEMLCLDKETAHYKALVAQKFADIVYNGQWYTPLREALSAFVDKTQENVTGDVKLKLYKGNIIPAGTTSPYSLYSEDLATFGEDSVYDQADSAGFIHLFGLPITVQAKLKEKLAAEKE